jgi:diguanylate cyclase (GGDEF)-like protein/PAS domain S-box-containing protein
MRSDTIRTSERTLGAFASAIKGSVIAAMKKGHHDDVHLILREMNAQYFIDRILFYNEQGRPLEGMETMHAGTALDINLKPEILTSVIRGDVTDISQLGGGEFISYYSSIQNQAECFRCHDRNNKINGIIRVDFSLRDLDDLIVARRNRALVWSAGLIVFLIAVLATLLRIFVSLPVKQLRDAMATVREGTDLPSFSLEGNDELTDLKRSFVTMLQRVTALHQMNLEKEFTYSREMMRLRAELQTMFDAMPDGVLLIDPDLKIIQSNPRSCELLPELNKLGGRLSETDLKEESCPHHEIQEAFHKAEVREHQCSIKLPDGQTRYLYSICAPVIVDGRVAYMVEVIHDITARVKAEYELAEKTAELSAANRALSQIANTDGLTQVFNRRWLDDILSAEIKRYNRRKYSALSLMMIDIDHFKQLNDRFGHLVGDMVLREVAKLLKESVRETDTIARFGGEEFVVLLLDTGLDGAALKAEELRQKVQDRKYFDQDEMVYVTISIGVAAYISGSPDDLINAADQAMYQAKHSGRNAVMVSRPEGSRV